MSEKTDELEKIEKAIDIIDLSRRAWKCGRCGREYSFEEYDRLPLVDLGAGRRTRVCRCGYRFHVDKWTKKTEVKLGDLTVTVSTVFLELNHGTDEKPLWYETMIFPNTRNVECEQVWRYETREEAERGHDRIVGLLESGRYKLKPTTYLLVVEEDGEK